MSLNPFSMFVGVALAFSSFVGFGEVVFLIGVSCFFV